MKHSNSSKKSDLVSGHNSERIYHIMFESDYYFNILIDLKGKFLDVNNSYADFVGIPRDELLGSHFFDLDIYAESEDPGKYEQQLSLFIAGVKTGPSEVKMNTPRGPRWIEVHPTLLEDNGEKIGVYVVGQDITDRKKVEKKYKFQANILKNIKEAVIVIDLDGLVLYWNQMAELLSGYKKNEVKGKPIEKVFYNITKKPIQDQIDLGKDFSGEYSLTKKNKAMAYVLLEISPVLDYKGDQIGFIILLKDITQRKKSDDALKASIHEKEMLVGEINKRMENYFNMISSLLEIQSSAMTSQKDLENLKDNQNRIKSLLLLHNVLTKSDDFAVINFSKFIRRLVWQLKISYNLQPNVEINLNIDSIMLDVDQAVPCGLMANEFLTRAFKKEYSQVDGEINFDFIIDYNKFVMHVVDNGKAKKSKGKEISNNLVKNLVQQIGGTITISEDGISDIKVSWPASSF